MEKCLGSTDTEKDMGKMDVTANYVSQTKRRSLLFQSNYTPVSCFVLFLGQATVCSEHFDEDCFDIEVTMNDENTETRTRSILKEDAIPTLKLNQFAKL